MYYLDELKCDRQNQMVNIMITAPNQKACVYAKHTLAGVNRRIWTDNQFEDCHNAEMLGMVYPIDSVETKTGSKWTVVQKWTVRLNLDDH